MNDRVTVEDISKRPDDLLSPIGVDDLFPLPPPYDKLEDQPGWKEIKCINALSKAVANNKQ